jgi:hypothetical protein
MYSKKHELYIKIDSMENDLKKYSNQKQEHALIKETMNELKNRIHNAQSELKKFGDCVKSKQLERDIALLEKKYKEFVAKLRECTSINWIIKKTKIKKTLQQSEKNVVEIKQEIKDIKASIIFQNILYSKELLLPRIIKYLANYGIDVSYMYTKNIDSKDYEKNLDNIVYDAFNRDNDFSMFDFKDRENCGYVPNLNIYLSFRKPVR